VRTLTSPASQGADDVVARVIPWFAFWHILFWLSHLSAPIIFSTFSTLDTATKCYWSASMVSTIHAVFICYLAVVAAINIDVVHSNDLFRVDSSSSLANVVFMSYLCSDLLLSLIFNNRWPGWKENVLHHVTGIWCWYVMEKGNFGHVIALVAQLTEATTPFINNRFFFDKVPAASLENHPLSPLNTLFPCAGRNEKH
jgi:hypothetical protein